VSTQKDGVHEYNANETSDSSLGSLCGRRVRHQSGLLFGFCWPRSIFVSPQRFPRIPKRDAFNSTLFVHQIIIFDSPTAALLGKRGQSEVTRAGNHPVCGHLLKRLSVAVLVPVE
jgi:hypothetical protein